MLTDTSLVPPTAAQPFCPLFGIEWDFVTLFLLLSLHVSDIHLVCMSPLLVRWLFVRTIRVSYWQCADYPGLRGIVCS